MGRILDKIKEKRENKQMEEKIASTKITPKGACFYQYISDLLEKKEVFNQAYEDDLTRIAEKSGKTREEVLYFLKSFFRLIKNN